MTSSNDPIVLYGGQGNVFASLNLSAEDMPYLMLETAEYGIAFGSTAKYIFTPDWTILRLHAFGPGGDLLIRRDEDRIFWRFVGKQQVFDGLGLKGGKSYNEAHKTELTKGSVEKALLWGRYDKKEDKEDEDRKRGYRYESRMGKADLTSYPHVDESWSRVEIHAWSVLDANEQIVVHWTHKLAPHPEKPQNQPQEKQS